jgi:universal stress protein A
MLIGNPASEILTVAEMEAAELIIMGSHGRRGLSRLVLGSVAEAVAHRAKCPVLIVKCPRRGSN